MKALLAAHREQILLELRQLSGAAQRLALHQIGHVHLRVAVLLRVQIEHELPERTVQPRDLAAHHHEACPGDAGGRLEIEAAEPLAAFHK